MGLSSSPTATGALGYVPGFALAALRGELDRARDAVTAARTAREKAEARWERADAEARYGASVPRPPHWGGYRVVPDELEFWQGRPSRLHDRFSYTRTENGWDITRLMP